MPFIINPFGFATGGGGGSTPNKVLWLKSWTGLWQDTGATTAATANGDPIARWDDQSGNGNNVTQSTGANQPALDTGTTFNSNQTIAFTAASSHFLNFPDLSGLTAGELFVSFKVTNDPALSLATSGLYKLDTGATSSHFPYTDGNIYDGFGSSSARFTVGNPTPSLSAAFNVYNPHSATNDWAAYLGNTQLFTFGTNTVGFPAAGTLGLGSGTGNAYLDGWICEFLLYDGVLSSSDRTSAYNYMSSGTGSPP
jgi:hypothetical protein